ncbi:SCO family protein [Leptospira idonii]|uniref:SCO family protein n=2 Tax=Leptospira idonii TaxID=1193500 RepID=A0A4R9LWJ2_9LEPT|nr:SCO family protein [Leptospira idonii]
MKSFFHYSALIIFTLILFGCDSWEQESGKKDSSLTFFAKPEKDKLPYFRGKDLEAFWSEQGDLPEEVRMVDAFSFQNQLDQNIKETHLKDKITIVSFFFAKCHGICPSIIRNLKFVQSAYGKEPKVQIVSYSVTPDLDTPFELKKFGEEKGIWPQKWSLLTGDREKIFRLARNTFQADTNTTNKDSVKDFVHSEQIFLIDENLRFRGIYNGNRGESVKIMIDDIKLLLKEKPLPLN